MKSVMDLPREHEAAPVQPEGTEAVRESVLRELDRIVSSRFFRSAVRSKQFLEYVVHHKLDGHPEQLKERTIGTEVFQRPAGYATGDDPVVRVQAGEVRRRLEQYYQGGPADSHMRIELPVGSYSPTFIWAAALEHHEPPPLTLPVIEAETPHARRPRWLWLLLAASLLVAIGAGITILTLHHASGHKTTIDQFWAPAFVTGQPVLICLAKPIAYRPTEDIYRRYSRNHPGTFQTEAERSNEPLPLDPGEKLSWGDLFIYKDYGVAGGDVHAAVALSGLMGKLGKPTQLRIGSSYTYEDLRNSPAVVVGGFNNRWTMQLTSNLHYAFVEDHGQYMIREQTANGQTWRTKLKDDGDTTEDFGMVSRQVDSKTGQFIVTVAGIGPMATEAAGEFVANEQYLQEGLRKAPANWQGGNMEIVLQTTVTDSVAGPPQVVAAYYW